jgi:hypothetical protein
LENFLLLNNSRSSARSKFKYTAIISKDIGRDSLLIDEL